MVTAAVDLHIKEYTNMLKTSDCQPPQIIASVLILDVLGVHQIVFLDLP